MTSIYEMIIDVDDDVIEMIYDIIRIVTLQIITQALFCMNNKEVHFFNNTFIQTVLFLSIGLAFYWLIIKKILKFNNTKDRKKTV